MAVDLGDLYRITFTLTDPGGQPVDADVMSLTIMLPDGTNTEITPVASISTGQYQYDYLTVQVGRHVAHWVGTGTNPGANAEVFDVGLDSPALISLRTAKKQLNLSLDDTGEDDEVRDYVEAASLAVERHLGEAVAVRTVTERQRLSGGLLVLNVIPVLSVLSLASLDGSRTWDVSSIYVSPAGVAHVGHLTWWFRHDVVAGYKVGQPAVAANIRLATAIIVEHLWQTKRGSRGVARPGAMDDTMMARGMGFAVPNRALELLGDGMPGVA